MHSGLSSTISPRRRRTGCMPAGLAIDSLNSIQAPHFESQLAASICLAKRPAHVTSDCADQNAGDLQYYQYIMHILDPLRPHARLGFESGFGFGRASGEGPVRQILADYSVLTGRGTRRRRVVWTVEEEEEEESHQ